MTEENAKSRSGGYRLEPAGGPRLRTDIVDVYVYRQVDESEPRIELLLLQRASEPLGLTWQPVMGHVETGENAPQTALRELDEEVGLIRVSADILGFWALEQTHPYYIATIDAIVLSPRFAVQVAPDWEPTLNSEHLDHKWICISCDDPGSTLDELMWPGQKLAVAEIVREILPAGSLSRKRLAINPRDVPVRSQL